VNVFQLGRMRHLDLLALWCQAHPGDDTSHLVARLSKDQLAATLAGGLHT
jgi:hypothetical protein